MRLYQANLRSLVVDNPSQAARLDDLDPLYQRWLGLVAESFSLQNDGQSGAARAIFSGAGGKLLLDQITAILGQMSEEESQLHQDRSVEAAQRSQLTLATFLFLIGAMLAMLVYGYRRIRADLSRRRDYERLLAAERKLLRTVIDTVPDTIYVKDSALRFLLINRAQAALSGAASPEDAIGKRDEDYFPAEMVRSYAADEQSIIATGQPLVNHEEQLRGADGELHFMLTTKVPVRSSSGEIIQIVGISHDITARKKTEMEVEALNQSLRARTVELETANGELEAFSYSVSHDLRAPLRAVDGFTRILLEDYAHEFSPEAMRYLQKVRGNSQRMGELIDDLLHFSRLSRQALHKRTVRPAELVQQILDEELRTEHESRPVEISIQPMPVCEADPGLLRQAYANLLGNAIKFTSKSATPRIEVGAEQLDGEVVYFVKDNGAGFDPKYKDKLFGVFQRLHRPEDYEGTGVGLAIVHRVVTRHGGRIWADGAVNQGASFYFTLGDGRGESNGGHSSR
jgi:PAS domain S-box-containing protein